MNDISGNIINQYGYNAHAGSTLISQVARVMCIMLPRELIVAGYGQQGDLLMVRHSDYKKTAPSWALDFFENQFNNELLLSNPDMVKHIFVGSDKYLMVPDELFNQQKAEKWLEQLYYISFDEIVNTYPVRNDHANYIFAWESAVKSLITRHFPQAKVLPFAAYQFLKTVSKTPYYLQCCITADEVYATLYQNRSLQWHQVFDYAAAEDIAYHIKLVSKQYNISEDEWSIQCNVSNISLLPFLHQLEEYFPNIKEGNSQFVNNDPVWSVTAQLLQQLQACVS